jgi:hypothetical protein
LLGGGLLEEVVHQSGVALVLSRLKRDEQALDGDGPQFWGEGARHAALLEDQRDGIGGSVQGQFRAGLLGDESIGQGRGEVGSEQ